MNGAPNNRDPNGQGNKKSRRIQCIEDAQKQIDGTKLQGRGRKRALTAQTRKGDVKESGESGVTHTSRRENEQGFEIERGLRTLAEDAKARQVRRRRDELKKSETGAGFRLPFLY